jgi:hypothetical protein
MSDGYDDETLSEDEARLLADLARALGPDVPPAGLVTRAEGLVAFMDVDRELVELLDEAAAEPVGSRGTSTSGRLGFELGNGSISLEVSFDGEVPEGQVLSGNVVAVSLEGLGGVLDSSAVDALGRFSLRSVPTGPVRLRLEDGSGRPLATDWFLL